MTIKTSTGLRKHLAVTGSVKNALDGGLIKFYNGAIPATADAAATGDNLWVVSLGGDGTGLVFDATAVDSAAVKPSAATWQGPTSAGTPTYWRFVAAADDGSSDPTSRRIQGSCGNTAGSDIYLTNPVLTTDSDVDAKVLDDFSVLILTD